jgi:anti-anti-sigma regulatory factor
MEGPYMPHKMLFQAITRARKKLKLIIVNNPEILERCMEILGFPKKE